MIGNINMSGYAEVMEGKRSFAMNSPYGANNISNLNNLRAMNYDTYNNKMYKKQRAKNILAILGLGVVAVLSACSLKKNGAKIFDKAKNFFTKNGAGQAQDVANKTSFFDKLKSVFKRKKS